MHVLSKESLKRRTGHHLNHTVQDCFGSGIPGSCFHDLLCCGVLSSNSPATSEALAELQRNKRQLRAEMRRRRRALGPHQQREAARRLYRRLIQSPLFRHSKRIAFTVARDGEIDPSLLLKAALRRGKACYLPVMSRVGEPRLEFRRWSPGQRMTRGAFAIPEPRHGKRLPPWALGLVLLPLVAFDADGRRLGMGKGFYDRSFAFLARGGRTRPALVGLAHECQRVERLEVASWDVPLKGIVTDQAWYGA